MSIHKELEALRERNRRVELDKAWEVSGFRRGLIALFTYGAAVLFMVIAHLEKPWLGALVPSMGYLFSTFSLPPIKRWWIGKRTTLHSEKVQR